MNWDIVLEYKRRGIMTDTAGVGGGTQPGVAHNRRYFTYGFPIQLGEDLPDYGFMPIRTVMLLENLF